MEYLEDSRRSVKGYIDRNIIRFQKYLSLIIFLLLLIYGIIICPYLHTPSNSDDNEYASLSRLLSLNLDQWIKNPSNKYSDVGLKCLKELRSGDYRKVSVAMIQMLQDKICLDTDIILDIQSRFEEMFGTSFPQETLNFMKRQ